MDLQRGRSKVVLTSRVGFGMPSFEVCSVFDKILTRSLPH